MGPHNHENATTQASTGHERRIAYDTVSGFLGSREIRMTLSCISLHRIARMLGSLGLESHYWYILHTYVLTPTYISYLPGIVSSAYNPNSFVRYFILRPALFLLQVQPKINQSNVETPSSCRNQKSNRRQWFIAPSIALSLSLDAKSLVSIILTGKLYGAVRCGDSPHTLGPTY